MLVPIAASPEAEHVSRRAAVALGRALRAFFSWCARCCARAQQRRALRELDAEQLRDIGLTEGTALREAEKPFWKP